MSISVRMPHTCPVCHRTYTHAWTQTKRDGTIWQNEYCMKCGYIFKPKQLNAHAQEHRQ